ncbi:MAG: hypothetical protein WCF36_05340 [Candidatus Nanopelagicales bacterium]
MTAPEPRPALRKAADAHIHPAAPGHALHTLLPATQNPMAAVALPAPRTDTQGTVTQPADAAHEAGNQDAPPSHRLSGPLRGTTSDGLRAATRRARPARAGKSEKTVDLGVQVPKSVRKEFRAAARADHKDPDVIVTALLKSWLGT